jgi:Arc-like DNA binding domain
MARKTQELRPVMTRIPETLRRRLERAAMRNNRSMNTEIIHRLEGSFAEEAGKAQGRRDRESLSEIRERLDGIIALLGRAEEAKDDGEQQ